MLHHWSVKVLRISSQINGSVSIFDGKKRSWKHSIYTSQECFGEIWEISSRGKCKHISRKMWSILFFFLIIYSILQYLFLLLVKTNRLFGASIQWNRISMHCCTQCIFINNVIQSLSRHAITKCIEQMHQKYWVVCGVPVMSDTFTVTIHCQFIDVYF